MRQRCTAELEVRANRAFLASRHAQVDIQLVGPVCCVLPWFCKPWFPNRGSSFPTRQRLLGGRFVRGREEAPEQVAGGFGFSSPGRMSAGRRGVAKHSFRSRDSQQGESRDNNEVESLDKVKIFGKKGG